MPTSGGNPYPLSPLDIPKTPGGMPASGPPMTGFAGIKTQYPIQKLFLSGAVRRDVADVSFGTGQVLSAGITYTNYAIIQRAALITGIYLAVQTLPSVAATLSITYNGVSLLSTANVSVISGGSFTSGQVAALTLATTGAFIDATSKLPYLTSANGAGGLPYPILCSWVEAGSGSHTVNPGLIIEFEPDDFNG